ALEPLGVRRLARRRPRRLALLLRGVRGQPGSADERLAVALLGLPALRRRPALARLLAAVRRRRRACLGPGAAPASEHVPSVLTGARGVRFASHDAAPPRPGRRDAPEQARS